MLERLSIQNFALISDQQIEYSEGLNIFSGETGAGKSILIGALGLLFGQKADTSMIRTGCDQTRVSAVLHVTEPDLLRWLQEHDIPCDDGTVVIKRTVNRTGRGSMSLQYEPVTLKILKEFTSLCFDLHGQHEHQSLIHPTQQRIMVDRYGGLEEQVRAFGELFVEYESLRAELENMKDHEREYIREMDMSSFAVEEIDALQLQTGEDAEIELELQRLTQFERLLEDISVTKEALGFSDGALAAVSSAVKGLQDAQRIDETLKDAASRIESVQYEIEDILEEVRHYADTVQFSPERLEELQDRYDAIRTMKKKYGSTIEEVLAFRDDALERLQRFESFDTHLSGLEADTAACLDRLKRSAEELSAARAATAAELEGLITGHLHDLGMRGSSVSIVVSRRESTGDLPAFTSHGADKVEFFIEANTGERAKRMRDTASGGELSRIMLAVKTVFSESERIETLIFDEIDAGIGGSVAVAVGEHLEELSKKRQVLCITHLASVAAKAQNHIVVHKEVRDERTETIVRIVTGDEQVEELARMLSGSSDEQAALTHARTLVTSRQ